MRAVALAVVPRRMVSAIIGGRPFPAPWLAAGASAARFTARCWNTLSLVAIVNVFVPVAPRPGIRGAILVATPHVPLGGAILVAISLVLDVLFVAGCAAIATCACPVHSVGPLAKPLAQRVDLAADRGNGSRLPGVDKTTFHLVSQLGELRRRGEQLCALLDQTTRTAGQLSAAS
jgi:hypothetical protein